MDVVPTKASEKRAAEKDATVKAKHPHSKSGHKAPKGGHEGGKGPKSGPGAGDAPGGDSGAADGDEGVVEGPASNVSMYAAARDICSDPRSLQFAPAEIRNDAEALASFAAQYAPQNQKQQAHDGCLAGLKSIGIG